MNTNKKVTLAMVSCLTLGACATQPDTGEKDRNNAAIGAVIGAVAGAVIGGQTDNDGNRDRGVITGAVLGAAAGAGIGYHMDKQEDEFRAALADEQRRSEIEIQRVRDDLLKLTFENEVTFDINSSAIKSHSFSALDKVSSVIAKYESKAEVVGHTDSTGSDSHNFKLSEDRAYSVKTYLENHGVSPTLLSFRGRGELEPRASNDTASGRQLNRRVELYITPSQ